MIVLQMKINRHVRTYIQIRSERATEKKLEKDEELQVVRVNARAKGENKYK